MRFRDFQGRKWQVESTNRKGDFRNKYGILVAAVKLSNVGRICLLVKGFLGGKVRLK